MRKPRQELYDELLARSDDLAAAGIASITRIGDALAPGAIVHAVHSGHRFAREFDMHAGDTPYSRDFPV
jgi:dimethylamine/trimethylamine dehydrogenase